MNPRVSFSAFVTSVPRVVLQRRRDKPIIAPWRSLALIVTATALLCAGAGQPRADGVPGSNDSGLPLTRVELGSIVPIYQEVGRITASIDGLGTNNSSGGLIQVNKPAGATVRKAFISAASTGFSGRKLVTGDVRIDGASFAWDISTASSISSWNHWADITSLIKQKIDAAPPGIVNFTITEVNTFGIDGEILAVVFDDPSQTEDNTVAFLFGAQNVNGDRFAVATADPIDKTNPNVRIQMSLGISFGFQPSGQFSQVNVNGVRLTTSAGGQDDGESADGALLTVGGIGDSPGNPANPFQTDGAGPRTDDELYDLLPFVPQGAKSITVDTLNPSHDDNIFFSGFFFGGTTAVVGEGVTLGPLGAEQPVGTPYTFTATLQDTNGNPIGGRSVTLNVVNGPNTGVSIPSTSDSSGHATFTYASSVPGMDVVRASFLNSRGEVVTSNTATVRWIIVNHAPIADAGSDQTVEAQGPLTAVTLNGTQSSDPDGDSLTYAWSGPFGTASGATPTVNLPVGSSAITLTVTDTGALSSSDEVVVKVLDTTPPVLSVPGDLTVEATGPAGAAVPFTVSATDLVDGAVAVACMDQNGNLVSSGSVFPLGTTTVTCTSTDSHSNNVSKSFKISVVDTTPPVLSNVPGDITVTATSTAGAVVNFGSATATDLVDQDVIPVASPTSGSTFAPGQTTVTVTAADDSGNSTKATFKVTVTFSWSGILPPVNPDGTSVFKLNSTIPFKFALTGASAGITDLAAHIQVQKLDGNQPAGQPADATSTSAATTGNLFRYDPSSGQYIFNLATKSLSVGTWQALIDLGDGKVYTIKFGLR